MCRSRQRCGQRSMQSTGCHRDRKGECNSQNSDGRCNADFGTKDGSTWCADPDWGCSKRMGAPTVNTLACCLGQKTSLADCGDSWCPLSDACVPTLGAYCGASPEHVTENICRTFCAEPSNKPYCDAAMTQYCDAKKAAGVKDDLCACIWASEADAIAPSCFDAQCNATGYKTDAQFKASLKCPTYCPQVVGCWNTGSCTADNDLVETYWQGLPGCMRNPDRWRRQHLQALPRLLVGEHIAQDRGRHHPADGGDLCVHPGVL